MAMPTEESICLPLLKVIADAGGALPTTEAIRCVETFFPELTEADKLRLQPRGKNRVWDNRVQWARQKLVQKGYFEKGAPKGIWQIARAGKEYLESEWPKWKPKYSSEAPDPKSTPVVENIRDTEKEREECPAKNTDKEIGEYSFRVHEKLKNYLHEVGEILGKYAQKEHHEPPYVYDVIWREFPEAPRATHVFEVQDKGNLVEALAKLQHAKDIWGSKPFLIITGEKNRRKLLQLTIPLLSGTFHRLSRQLVIVSLEELEELYEVLSRRKELVKHFLT